jgi:6-phosphogluconate dehydrogenase
MDLAMIGLGRMGGNMARRLLRDGHRVVLWNRTHAKAVELAAEFAGGGEEAQRAATAGRTPGEAVAVENMTDIVAQLPAPRALWFMLPQGPATDEAIAEMTPLLAPGDIVIDGGNSYFEQDIARAEALAPKGLRYLDAGTSGGVWGLDNGYCLMVGGDESAFRDVEPAIATLAPGPEGYGYMGGAGSGHFVKMVHNGIEYGMMQAYGEGFELLAASRWELDLAAIAHLWDHSSVVRSWLLELAADALDKDPKLETITGYVEDTGEGRWTVQQAIELGVPMPVIAESLFARFRSRQDDSFSNRMLAALRNEFGGHAVKEKGT